MNAPGNPVPVTATAVIAAHATTLHRIVVGVAAAGQTVKFHDCATTGAAGAGNLKATVALDAVQSHEFGAAFRDGLVAVVSGGTPNICAIVG